MVWHLTYACTLSIIKIIFASIMESFIKPTDFISKYKNCAYIECYMTYLFPKKDIKYCGTIVWVYLFLIYTSSQTGNIFGLLITWNRNSDSKMKLLKRCNPHPSSRPEIQLDCDEALHLMRGTGLWQLINFLLLCFPSMASGFLVLSYVYTGGFDARKEYIIRKIKIHCVFIFIFT